jgi:hypothetical protein
MRQHFIENKYNVCKQKVKKVGGKRRGVQFHATNACVVSNVILGQSPVYTNDN